MVIRHSQSIQKGIPHRIYFYGAEGGHVAGLTCGSRGQLWESAFSSHFVPLLHVSLTDTHILVITSLSRLVSHLESPGLKNSAQWMECLSIRMIITTKKEVNVPKECIDLYLKLKDTGEEMRNQLLNHGSRGCHDQG